MHYFHPTELAKLYRPQPHATKTQNGQLTIIGGSDLFHGAPLLALKCAARIVDMVYFTSPEPANSAVAAQLKSHLSSFIWVPIEEIDSYIAKSNAILIGPGLKRFNSENHIPSTSDALDHAGQLTKQLSEHLLKQFPDKQWIIDAGAIQTISMSSIPAQAIITPNLKEYRALFGDPQIDQATTESIAQHVQTNARQHNCIIVYKQPETIIASPDHITVVPGGNAGLSKGGTGDTLAGLTAALASQNPAFLAAAAASFILKSAADQLFRRVGPYYSADDLANHIPRTLHQYLSLLS